MGYLAISFVLPRKRLSYHLRVTNSMYFFFFFFNPERIVQETTFDLGGDVHSGTALPTSKVGDSHGLLELGL